MKGEKDRVEELLEKNAAEQLAKVNWDRLTDRISSRLDRAPRAKAMPSRYPSIFRIAAGLAVAAAVLVAMTFRMHKPLDEGGAGLIQIKDANGKILATVQVGRTDERTPNCTVEIIDRNGDVEADSSRATWIIISAPTQAFAENGYDREEADTICLL